jgi:hypothetical protein
MDTARKTVRFLLWLLLFPALCHAMDAPEVTQPGNPIVWKSPEAGMESAALSYTMQKGDGYARRMLLHILRMDTEHFDFQLFSAKWDGGRPRTMREWIEEKGLAAAINACMYLTDGLTSTGYLRKGDKHSNSRIVKRFGAFFVSGPRQAGLPRAAVLDRTSDDWQSLLPLYENVVQNFRLMGRNGEQLWPENGPRHAVAAVAEDRAGRILFLLCSEPVSVHDFVDALNAYPELDLKSAMYTEGGSDATLIENSGASPRLLNGLSPTGYMLSPRGDDIPLPNIIGAKRR